LKLDTHTDGKEGENEEDGAEGLGGGDGRLADRDQMGAWAQMMSMTRKVTT